MDVECHYRLEILYSIAYPAWPLVKEATTGLLGYSTRGEVAKDIQSFADAAIEAKLAADDITAVADDRELQSYAVNSGRVVFKTNGIQCHGAGALSYPSLLDDDWL